MRTLIVTVVTFISFSVFNLLDQIFNFESENVDKIIYELSDIEDPAALNYRYENMLVLIPKSDELREISPLLGNDFNGFKEAIGHRESSGSYTQVNEYGYIGKYQIGKNAMKDLGIDDPLKLLNSPYLQERAFIALCSLNKYRLRNYIEEYEGCNINGIVMTESGMLAAAHLLGPGAVISFLRSEGSNAGADAYGTSILEYLVKFKDFDTSVISPVKEIDMGI